jgi:hypothetical protein
MKRIKDGWLIVRENPGELARRFAAQPKIYYEDGTSQLLHIHSGDSRQEAEAKAQVELDQFIAQNN